MSSKELKAQAVEAVKAGKLEAFLKEHGCEATLEEVAAFLKEKSSEDKPLSVNELENAAGGECNGNTALEGILSTFTAGFVCILMVGISAGTGRVGQVDDKNGRLCDQMVQ